MKHNPISVLVLVLICSNLAQGQINEWILKSAMPTPRSGICAVELDGKIYVIGGRDSNDRIVDVVERYDPESDSWETGLSALRRERENAAAAIYQNTIFVLGGRDAEGEVRKDVEFYDAAEDEWEGFDDLELRRDGLTAVTLRNRLYAIGGLGGSDDADERFLDSVEFYDTDEEEWHVFDDWRLDFARASFASVVFGDSVYTIGGFSSLGPLGFIQRFHPGLGTASQREMETPRGGLAAAGVQDKIFAIGGRDGNDAVTDNVEFFRPALNFWESGQPLNTARESFAAVAIDNRIYVFGGQDPDGNTLSSVEMILVVEPATSVAELPEAAPAAFVLRQNYPNPFNPATRIAFEIFSGQEQVKLSIYSITGELVRTLVDHQLTTGSYEVAWNGKDEAGVEVANGAYFYVLRAGMQSKTRKMLLIR